MNKATSIVVIAFLLVFALGKVLYNHANGNELFS